jgi:hypothetical protein
MTPGWSSSPIADPISTAVQQISKKTRFIIHSLSSKCFERCYSLPRHLHGHFPEVLWLNLRGPAARPRRLSFDTARLPKDVNVATRMHNAIADLVIGRADPLMSPSVEETPSDAQYLCRFRDIYQFVQRVHFDAPKFPSIWVDR